MFSPTYRAFWLEYRSSLRANSDLADPIIFVFSLDLPNKCITMLHKTCTLPVYTDLFLRIFWLMDFTSIFDFKFSPLLILKTISLMFESDITSPTPGVCLPDLETYNIYLFIICLWGAILPWKSVTQNVYREVSPRICIEKCLPECILKSVSLNVYWKVSPRMCIQKCLSECVFESVTQNVH